MPGDDSNYMEDRKDPHNATHQEQKYECLCPLQRGAGIAKDSDTVKY